MIPQQFRKYRVLFIRSSCPHCRLYCHFIERINAKLPISKRIKVVDCEYTRYGVTSDPLILLFDKSIDGFPCLFIDGVKKSGANSVVESKAWLESYLNRELLISEENKFMFNKECEFNQSGIFKGRPICK